MNHRLSINTEQLILRQTIDVTDVGSWSVRENKTLSLTDSNPRDNVRLLSMGVVVSPCIKTRKQMEKLSR